MCETKQTKSAPEAPNDVSYEELGFDYPQKMVNWFSPKELGRAGVHAVISTVFGSYADKREIQALQHDQDTFDYASDKEEIWLDYIADLGDGWNSTYTMASLLAEPTLHVSDKKGETAYKLQRGSLLIMGGDQVYPIATKEEYKNRLWGPYECALPSVQNGQEPHLFAIPGNHDWYDGLTSFSRQFFQGRSIGAWKTKQKRSYFALKLPHGWWLWGVDTQLDADLDQPQIDYFKMAASKMKPGERLITCVPEPEWLLSQKEYKGTKAYSNLKHLESKIIEPAGIHHAVSLAGDLHAYSRYENEDRSKQRIMSGGGGAYLHATHKFPAQINVPTTFTGKRTEPFILGGTQNEKAEPALYPDAKTSLKLSWGAFKFPYKCFSFSLIFGVAYFILSWFMQSSSIVLEAISGNHGSSLLTNVSFDLAIRSIFHSPVATTAAATFLLFFYFFIQTKSLSVRIAFTVMHFAVHFMAIVCMMWLLVKANHCCFGNLPLNSGTFGIIMIAFMTLLGAVVAGLIIGGYLFVSHFFGHTHENEILSCQSIEDYKNFLRLHINKEGHLVVYPIGVDKVGKEWDLQPTATPGQPYFTPKDDPIAQRAHLIEPPIVND